MNKTFVIKESCSNYFGGKWTVQKLEVLQKYLEAYSCALKKQPFKRIYIDAFAGTGKIIKKTDKDLNDHQKLFTSSSVNELDHELVEYTDGSVKVALNLKNTFDEYWFNEKSTRKFNKLLKVKEESILSSKIHCANEDANRFLLNILKKYKWKNERAVIFLDPFGASVKFETLEQISKSQGLDVWILFPLGQAINRLLTKDLSSIPKEWEDKLDVVFGTTEWKSKLYEEKPNLFSPIGQGDHKKKSISDVNDYYMERLKKIFAKTADAPKILYNSKNCPLFSLFFCVTNKSVNAQRIALRIANHILKDC